MATVPDRAARPASAARHDAVVETQLSRARQRIRLLDVAVAVLGFAACTLAFALVMTLCNRPPGLAPATRQLAFAAYGVAALAYLGVLVAGPLRRRINPYYAARQIEQALPGAKNSLVNWLDLRRQDLPPAIQGAVSRQAAKDFAQADLEQAVSARRTAWLGGLTAALFLACFVALVTVGPSQFLSRLGGVFLPFSFSGDVPTRNRIHIVQPKGGDAKVLVGRSVPFAVSVEGKVLRPGKPDAPKLHFRYQQTSPYEVLSLEQEPGDGREWTGTILANQVHNDGFWYKVTAGDAETPAYRVEVRSPPLVIACQATYRYRPYLNWSDHTQTEPNLKAMRGTEVTLVARTNRTVKEGEMKLARAKQAIAGELVKDDPQALRFRLVLEEDDNYRISFRSAEGETNTEPPAYQITVLPDYPPQVQLTRPEEDDIRLPVNGLLQVEGSASDDIGVQSLALQVQVVDGPALKPKVYREGKSFRLSDGGYPKVIAYKDAVDLARVADRDGKDFALRPGMVVEFWLEAADAHDYPAPHVAPSTPRKRLTIIEPDLVPQKQEQERRQAAEEQKQHEARQDEKIKQEDELRQRDAKAGNQPNEARTPEKSNDPEQEKKDQQLEEEARRVKEKLNQKQEQERKERQEGQAKGDGQQEQSGGAKDGGQPGPQGEQGRGESKPEGQHDAKQKPGETKPEGSGQQSDKTQAKGPGQGGSGADQQPAGAAKGEPQPSARSEGKGPGKQDAANKGSPGSARDAGNQGTNDQTAQGQPKSAPPAKGDGSDPARAEAKGQDRKPGSQAQANPDQGRNARPEDVERLAKDLQSGDGKKQQQAADKLDQVSRNASDAQARDAARQALEKSGPKPGQDARPEDVARQANDLRNGDAQQRQEAADKLDQISRNAKDQQTRDAARKELDKAERRPGENAKPDDVAQQSKELQSGDPKKQQQAADKLDQMSRNAKDDQVRDAARQALEKAGPKPGSDAKPEDVARQEKQLQQGDPGQKKEAADKLDQIRRNAKDEKARDLAREAMEQAEKRPGETATPEDVARQSKELQGGDPQKQKDAADKLDQISRNARDEQAREAARKELEKAGQKPGQDARPEDVARQEKELQQGDEKKQRNAADKLDQINRNAKDEQAREAARKLLEKFARQKQDEQSPATAKQPPASNEPTPPETGGPKKGPPDKQGAEAGTGKASDPGRTTAEQGERKDGGRDTPDPNAQVKDRGQTDDPIGPGIPGTGEPRADQPIVQPPDPAGGAADSRHRERGGQLQLNPDELKKADEIKDELGWSKEKLESFRKAYEDYLKRRQAEAGTSDEDKPQGPQRGGDLSNTAAQRIKPTQGAPVDARYIGRGQPPPGYQEAEREFRRRIANLDAVPEKK